MTDRAIKMSDLDKLRERMDQIFKDLVRQNHPMLMKGEKSWVPAVDIYETSEEILLLAELAGVDPEAIQVTLEQGVLTISGVRQECCRDRKIRLHQMEIDFGSFHRRIRLGVPVEEEQITSVYSEGFLEVRIPKRFPDATRAIPIEDSE